MKKKLREKFPSYLYFIMSLVSAPRKIENGSFSHDSK